MPSWFDRVFKSDADVADRPQPVFEEEVPVEERRVLFAPVLDAVPADIEPIDGVAITARVDDAASCTFIVDRPLLERYSARFTRGEALDASPLAGALLGIQGVGALTVHGNRVVVLRNPLVQDDWEPLARQIGARIRQHLLSGDPAVTDAWKEALPPEDEIREALEWVIDREINPGIASHGGAIALDRVEGNTVYVRMMGGCQGCAASSMTLRQGVHEAFRDAVPEIGAIVDITDHEAGDNPYYQHLPPEMES